MLTVRACMQQCEDLEDGESLRHLYHIIRGAIMLNDANLLDLLLAEENVMDMVSHSTVMHGYVMLIPTAPIPLSVRISPWRPPMMRPYSLHCTYLCMQCCLSHVSAMHGLPGYKLG